MKPTARENHAMATIHGEDKIVLYGGDDGSSNDETWVYDLSDNMWYEMYPTESGGSLGAKVSHEMATIYGDDKVVLFGVS